MHILWRDDERVKDQHYLLYKMTSTPTSRRSKCLIQSHTCFFLSHLSTSFTFQLKKNTLLIFLATYVQDDLYVYIFIHTSKKSHEQYSSDSDTKVSSGVTEAKLTKTLEKFVSYKPLKVILSILSASVSQGEMKTLNRKTLRNFTKSYKADRLFSLAKEPRQWRKLVQSYPRKRNQGR